MIRIKPEWEEESPGPIPMDVHREFAQLIMRLAAKGNPKGIYELFKRHFAAAAKTSYDRSSTESFALSDLDSYMAAAFDNAPLYITHRSISRLSSKPATKYGTVPIYPSHISIASTVYSPNVMRATRLETISS
jgi:hypothetical protein